MLNFFRQMLAKKPRQSLCSTSFYVISAGFFGLMLLVVFSLTSSYRTLSSVEVLVGDVIDSSHYKMELVYNMSQLVREREIKLHQAINERDEFVRDMYIAEYAMLTQQFSTERQALESQAMSEKEVQINEKLRAVLNVLYPAQIKIQGALTNGNIELAVMEFVEVAKKQALLKRILSEYSTIEENIRQRSSREIQRAFDGPVQWTGFLYFFLVVAGSLVSFFVVRFVSNQQKKLFEMNNTLESYNKVLRQSAEEAERSNKAKLEFIDNLSHELRTPMTTIKGALGILNADMIEGIPDEAKNLIKMADRNSDQLIDIMNDVLDFSKLETDEINIVKNEFNIHREIEKFLIPFYHKARNKSLNLKVYFSDKLPVTVNLDSVHLFQILNQLINNAIKFTPEGDISLDIEYKEDAGSILFHVTDTGIGLNEEDIQYLFRSFVQGDGSSTRKYGGTGIGLSICKKLTDALQGEIKVSSEKEKGSVFSLSLPIDIAA